MRKTIITLLSLLFLINSNLFAQKEDSTLEKLMQEAGDKTYLKDFPFELDPGKEKQFTISLKKRTLYEWYADIPGSNTLRITLYDKYANRLFQNKDKTGIINFSTKCNKDGRYLLNIKNNSNRRIKSTILLTFNGRFRTDKNFSETDFGIDELVNHSDGTFLKDFKATLEPGSEAKYSVVLSRNTIYELLFFQYNKQCEVKLYSNENLISPTIENINPDITTRQYTIPKTAVYHLIISNLGDKKINAITLLTFIDKMNDENQQEDKSQSIDNKTYEKPNESEEIFFQVESMPKFNGKQSSTFNDFIKSEMRYPQDALEKKIEGRVFVQFTVGKDGYIKNAKVVRGTHPSLDQEALRIVYSSPKWEPGIQNKQAVDVILTFPIIFKL